MARATIAEDESTARQYRVYNTGKHSKA